jgi:hypothetical protein
LLILLEESPLSSSNFASSSLLVLKLLFGSKLTLNFLNRVEPVLQPVIKFHDFLGQNLCWSSFTRSTVSHPRRTDGFVRHHSCSPPAQ